MIESGKHPCAVQSQCITIFKYISNAGGARVPSVDPLIIPVPMIMTREENWIESTRTDCISMGLRFRLPVLL